MFICYIFVIFQDSSKHLINNPLKIPIIVVICFVSLCYSFCISVLFILYICVIHYVYLCYSLCISVLFIMYICVIHYVFLCYSLCISVLFIMFIFSVQHEKGILVQVISKKLVTLNCYINNKD